MNRRLFTHVFLFFVCFAGLFLSGCATFRPTMMDYSTISRIKTGETTEAELIQMLGEPNSRSVDSEGFETLIWIYAGSSVKEESFVAYAFMGGTKSKHEILSVRLTNGKVTEFVDSRRANAADQLPLVLKESQIRWIGATGTKIEFPSGDYVFLCQGGNRGVYYLAPRELILHGGAAHKKGGVYFPVAGPRDLGQGVWFEKADPPGQNDRSSPYRVEPFSPPIAFEIKPPPNR